MWRIQLTIVNKFISFIDNDQEFVMYSISDNIEAMINNKEMKLYKNFLIHLKIDINGIGEK